MQTTTNLVFEILISANVISPAERSKCFASVYTTTSKRSKLITIASQSTVQLGMSQRVLEAIHCLLKDDFPKTFTRKNPTAPRLVGK